LSFYHYHFNMLTDILFYAWLLMVLPSLVLNHSKILDWLWWYPLNLRRMRNFRLRRLVGFFFIWWYWCVPLIIMYERSRSLNPLLGI